MPGGMAMANDAVRLRAFKGRLGIHGHEIPLAFTARVKRPGHLLVLSASKAA